MADTAALAGGGAVHSQLKIGRKGVRAIIYAALAINLVMILLPLLWLVFTSLKSQADLAKNIWGPPAKVVWANYLNAWVNGKMRFYLLNSVIATASSIILSIAASVTLAYALSRFSYKLNRVIYYVIIAGMMVPIHAAVIPLYITAMNLKMMNNLVFLGAIYGAFRIPVSVFIMESFMITIPKELEECAIIDGAGYYRIFWKVILPLSADGVVTIAILSALASWNELLISMLMLSKPFLKTIPIGLMGFITEWTSEYTILCAGMVIACVPNILFYAFMQEKIQKGMTVGAVKG
ncbi:MAG: carbohydrate ABC transporter permease [Candidatus Competibacteraceae bacterium]|nr:carbohydrate ABC transporter permease [Candidatus Competibacteraceae bacterium]